MSATLAPYEINPPHRAKRGSDEIVRQSMAGSDRSDRVKMGGIEAVGQNRQAGIRFTCKALDRTGNRRDTACFDGYDRHPVRHKPIAGNSGRDDERHTPEARRTSRQKLEPPFQRSAFEICDPGQVGAGPVQVRQGLDVDLIAGQREYDGHDPSGLLRSRECRCTNSQKCFRSGLRQFAGQSASMRHVRADPMEPDVKVAPGDPSPLPEALA